MWKISSPIAQWADIPEVRIEVSPTGAWRFAFGPDDDSGMLFESLTEDGEWYRVSEDLDIHVFDDGHGRHYYNVHVEGRTLAGYVQFGE